MIKYAIADDHKIFRQGLKLALGDDHRLKCIGEAPDGNALLELIDRQPTDVILLDMKMPGMGGMEVLEVIRKKSNPVKVLILTMYEEAQFIIHMMEAGANGYLLKNAEPDEIKTAIHTVHKNEYYFNDLVSNTLLKTMVQKTKIPERFGKPVKLNDKEIEVLKLICAEKTATEIARIVYLSPRTVEGIRSLLLEKTGARNTAGLVLYAVKNNLYTG